ncbi:MAG: hypothetical protein ACRC3Y_17430, partial [Romboutsia sp.]|uniref:hypothetical protein n=1 Tax=Romboutsia sp. TaxID=1965302 RepID=UPI003F2E7F2F
MRSNKDTFFMLLAESLVLFLLFSMIGSDSNVSRFIAMVLLLSFIIAYSGSFLFDKFIRTYG